MKQHIDNTRRQLGELGTMAAQTEAMERQILERAEAMLEDAEKKIEVMRSRALMPGSKESTEYQELIADRGRLNHVIALARHMLGE